MSTTQTVFQTDINIDNYTFAAIELFGNNHFLQIFFKEKYVSTIPFMSREHLEMFLNSKFGNGLDPDFSADKMVAIVNSIAQLDFTNKAQCFSMFGFWVWKETAHYCTIYPDADTTNSVLIRYATPKERKASAEVLIAKYDLFHKRAAKLLSELVKEETKFDNTIILTQDVKIDLNTRFHRRNLNIMILGGSGAGKSRFFVKPNLMQMNTSYVVTDPSGELLQSCGKMLKLHGYDVKVFNLMAMENSNNYNPFAYLRDFNGEYSDNNVIKMVDVLMRSTKDKDSQGGDQFWEDSAKALISAIAFFLVEVGSPEEQNFPSVMALLKLAEAREGDENFQSPLDIMFADLKESNPDSMAVKYYTDFKKAGAETAKSILISCAMRLQQFNLPKVRNLTYTDNIDLRTIGDKKTALFIILPTSDPTFNFLAAMMYTQLFDMLYSAAIQKHKGRLPYHVRCILDEFANIPAIPGFEELLATMRKFEVSANIIIQNISQLKKMYKDSYEGLIGNCDEFLFLGGQEQETLKFVSEKLGKETIDIVNHGKTRGRQGSSSENDAILGRELMTTEEVNVMPPDDCVLFVKASYPFYGKKYNIEKHPNYKFLEDFDKKNAFDIDNLHTLKFPIEEDAEKAEETLYTEDMEDDDEVYMNEIDKENELIIRGVLGEQESIVEIPDDEDLECECVDISEDFEDFDYDIGSEDEI